MSSLYGWDSVDELNTWMDSFIHSIIHLFSINSPFYRLIDEWLISLIKTVALKRNLMEKIISESEFEWNNTFHWNLRTAFLILKFYNNRGRKKEEGRELRVWIICNCLQSMIIFTVVYSAWPRPPILYLQLERGGLKSVFGPRKIPHKDKMDNVWRRYRQSISITGDLSRRE